VVHDRRVDDKTLTFIVSGKLWRNSMIMQDRETGTLWSHVTGEALHGELTGRHLKILPSTQSSWIKWKSKHPETLVLAKDEEISASHYANYFDDPDRTGIFRSVWLKDRLPGKELVHGLQMGDESLAVTDARLRRAGSLDLELGGKVIHLEVSSDGGARAFLKDDTAAEWPLRTAYWFAWSSFFPLTEVLD
jgi:hypothetical protein